MATLKELREEAALSQRDLAAMSGVGHATICRLEQGKQKPTHKTRRKVAKALGVEPRDIEFPAFT